MILLAKLVDVLRDMSDAELQRREWVELQDSTVYFPSEMVSQLFDDTGLSDHLNKDKCPEELTEEVFGELRRLDRLTSRIDDTLPPEELLQSPEMVQVRALAARILDKIAGR